MKKIGLLSAFISLFYIKAFAGVALDFRADYLNVSKYSDALSADVKGQSYFTITRARMKFNGSFNERMDFDSRFDFLNGGDTKGDDGASKLVNYAMLINKLDEHYSFSVGKLSDSGISAWEGQTSSADMYFTSMAYYYPYLVGVRFDAKYDMHNLAFYITDGAEAGTSTSPIASDKTQSRSGLGLTYKGYFSGKTLNFITSYHVLPAPMAAAAPFYDQNNTYASMGIQYKSEAINWMVDYLTNTYGGQGTQAGTDASKNSLESTLKYNIGNWIPTLKYEASTVKNVSAVANGYYETNNASTSSASPTKLYSASMPTNLAYSNTVNQIAIGTEYKPKMDENFRYHFMYVAKTTGFDSAVSAASNKTINESKIILGVRIVADIQGK